MLVNELQVAKGAAAICTHDFHEVFMKEAYSCAIHFYVFYPIDILTIDVPVEKIICNNSFQTLDHLIILFLFLQFFPQIVTPQLIF